MKARLISLLIISFTLSKIAFAQGPIKIQMTSGKEVFTNYAYLSNGYGFSKGYVRIDGKKGEKISIESVDFIEGVDQDQKERYFEPIQYYGRVWAERSFNSDRIKIYYTDIRTGGWNYSYRSKYYLYKKGASTFKKLKMNNLKLDLADNQTSMEHLKKGKTIQWIQAALYVAGTAILVSSIASEFSNNKPGQLGPPGETSGIPPGMIIGAITLNIPWFLNPAKQKHYVNALKAYE